VTAERAPDTAKEARAAGIRVVLGMAALMWIVEVIDTIDKHRLDQWGIEPRDVEGLRGVVAAPFLHAGFDHLISNTIPFLVLGLLIALSGVARVLAVTGIVMLIGGLGTWIFAPENTLHIGASGIVFGYASYLISRGVFDKSLLELGLGAIVVAVWGAALLASLVPREGISWQGHLFGAIGGVVAARVLAPRPQAATSPAREGLSHRWP
jgi:membrane associated rhomboid family serine protease